MNLYLYNYNNYFNRIVKRGATLSDYGTPVHTENNVKGFNPRDGVMTTHIFGQYNNALSHSPDYMIVADGNTIVSRWFVIDSEYTRNGQYLVTLRRDVIAEQYAKVINAPCFVEKGKVNANNNLIFNAENMTFNQIKRSEELLKDETGCAWLVGFLSNKVNEENKPYYIGQYIYKGAAVSANTEHILTSGEYLKINDDYGKPVQEFGEGAKIKPSFNLPSPQVAGPLSSTNYIVVTEDYALQAEIKYRTNPDETVNGISTWTYYNYSDRAPIPAAFPGVLQNIKYGIWSKKQKEIGVPTNSLNEVIIWSDYAHASVAHYENETSIASITLPSYVPSTVKNTGINGSAEISQNDIDGLLSAFNSSTKAALKSLVFSYGIIPNNTQAAVDALMAENGKVIKDNNTGKLYKVNIVTTSNVIKENAVTGVTVYPVFNAAYRTSINTYGVNMTDSANNSSFTVQGTIAEYRITLEELPMTTGKTIVTISGDRYHLNDAPYDMFCMPYSDNLKVYKNGVLQYTADKALALSAFMELAKKYSGAGYIYDIQLVPYCPVRYMISANGIDVRGYTIDYITHTEGGSTTNIGALFYAQNSTFEFNIAKTLPLTNAKIQSMTEMYRLVSPNYSGQFQFNVAKNGGVTGFNVDCTYRPFSPYIHVNPIFGRLYGADYNDARGLICGGDFSLPIISDKWETYELNNKNYDIQFNRSIENMEVNNNLALRSARWNVATGALSGVASGAATGAAIGGAGGSVVGGIVGGVASVAGGIADIGMLKEAQAEALDYARDNYGYTLGNIQALPYSLSRVSAFNANNKFFPVLEYYDCTDEEKTALENKIKYDGMTIMTVGKIADFIAGEMCFIRGRIIRLDTINEDFHYINTIAEEISKGVFF